MLCLQIGQTDAVMGPWDAGSADAQRDRWGKGNLEQKGSSPGASGLWHISFKKPEIAQFHHLSDILMQSAACSATFLRSVRAKVLLPMLWFLRLLESTYHTQLSLGTAPVSWGCSPTILFIAFSRRSLLKKSVLRNTAQKMLPAVLN